MPTAHWASHRFGSFSPSWKPEDGKCPLGFEYDLPFATPLSFMLNDGKSWRTTFDCEFRVEPATADRGELWLASGSDGVACGFSPRDALDTLIRHFEIRRSRPNADPLSDDEHQFRQDVYFGMRFVLDRAPRRQLLGEQA